VIAWVGITRVRKARTTQQLVKREKNPLKDCRKRHISIHNPNLEVHHCEYCQGNVVATNDYKCTCCGHQVPKVAKNNYARLEKVLNKAQRDYGQLAQDWASFPTRKPVTLEIGLGSQVYRIDIKYVALWNEPMPKESKLQYIAKYYRLYGLRVWIPDDDVE